MVGRPRSTQPEVTNWLLPFMNFMLSIPRAKSRYGHGSLGGPVTEAPARSVRLWILPQCWKEVVQSELLSLRQFCPEVVGAVAVVNMCFNMKFMEGGRVVVWVLVCFVGCIGIWSLRIFAG